MQSMYTSFIPLDLFFLFGFIYIVKVTKESLPLTVIGWVGTGFWTINLIYDFVKILTM